MKTWETLFKELKIKIFKFSPKFFYTNEPKQKQMAKIFSAPTDLKLPRFDYKKSRTENQEEEDNYLEQLKAKLKARRPTDALVGEVIRFPAADGYARYMVAGSKPVELVHLPLDDAWSFEYAHRLTKKDIEQKVAQQKSIDAMFAKRK